MQQAGAHRARRGHPAPPRSLPGILGQSFQQSFPGLAGTAHSRLPTLDPTVGSQNKDDTPSGLPPAPSAPSGISQHLPTRRRRRDAHEEQQQREQAGGGHRTTVRRGRAGEWPGLARVLYRR